MATTYHSNGTSEDVQLKVNGASAGDTITIPLGVHDWTEEVTIDKGIHLQGAGSGRVLARSESSVLLGTGEKDFVLTTETIASIEALKAGITVGRTLRIFRTGSENGITHGNVAWMEGTVTSLIGSNLKMNITSIQGTETTHPIWIITTFLSDPNAQTQIRKNFISTNGMLILTEDTARSVELSGINFKHTDTGYGDLITIYPNAGEPVLIHDCLFNIKPSSPEYSAVCIHSSSNTGIIYNTSFVNLPFVESNGMGVGLKAPTNTSAWNEPSKMGANDTTGKSNFYFEDCDFHAVFNCSDSDDNARSVHRYCLFNNSALGSHGADTSNVGVRHMEIYNNEFAFYGGNGQTFNLNWWLLMRGGTGVITDNIVPAIYSQDYGAKTSWNLQIQNVDRAGGPNPLWSDNDGGVIEHPCPRQVGLGYIDGTGLDGLGRNVDSITFVGDQEPLHIWNNTGDGATNVGISGGVGHGVDPDPPEGYIQLDRDYVLGPKSGYTKFTYPHPLRADSGLAPAAVPTGKKVVTARRR